jgi:hypothetical protein
MGEDKVIGTEVFKSKNENIIAVLVVDCDRCAAVHYFHPFDYEEISMRRESEEITEILEKVQEYCNLNTVYLKAY